MSEALTVRVERRGAACLLTVSRPEKKNALDRHTVSLLSSAIDEASRDPALRGVVLLGEGDVFLSGGDLGEIARALEAPSGAEQVLEMGVLLGAIERAEIPVVAAVTGDVFGGGCELVLLCDYVFAEERAGFSFRHARMGLSPAWGGAARLCERVGPPAAARLLFTAERVPAAEAARMGLVGACVADETARDHALGFIDEVARADRAVVAEQKRLLLALRAEARGRAAEIEALTFKNLWGQPAHRAAMTRPRKA
jgi:enoyl-CoA hydratase/carnithine racemase